MKAFNVNDFCLKPLFVLSTISFVFSCRQMLEENKVTIENTLSNDAPISVKVNFQGIEYGDEISENNIGGGKSLKTSNLNSYTEVLDDDLGIAEVEETIQTLENNEYFTSLGLEHSETENLPVGTKYTIIAYKKTGYTYVFDQQQEFVVGRNSEMKFTGDQNYTLLIFSMGRAIVPSIFDKYDINKIHFNVVDNNDIFLYQRIDNFIPNENFKKDINVKLKAKSTGIRIILDTSDILGENLGGKITQISSSKIKYNYSNKIHLKNGTKKLSKLIEKNTVFEDVNNTILSNKIENIALLPKDMNNLEFSMELKIKGLTETIKTNLVLRNLKQGFINTYRIKLKRCGAYLGPNKTNWRQFMCHNLGADYSKNPFTPNVDIHGDKYQWGYKIPIIKQEDDIYQIDPVPGWNTVEKTNTWNRGIYDPCPDGYKVPTKSEWENVLKYNNLTRLGMWSNTGLARIANAGVMVGERLMLPAAGKRFQDGATYDVNGAEYNKGTMAIYWSSDPSNNEKQAYTLEIRGTVNNKVKEIVKHDALPVRCIKK